MQKKLAKKCNWLKMKLWKPTKICSICFQEVTTDSLSYFTSSNSCVCDKCLNEQKPHIQFFQIDDVKGFSLYRYEGKYVDLLYRFKGCGDYELKNVFLLRFSWVLRMFYRDYILVFMPSNLEDIKKRGFAHVQEIFSSLHLPFWDGLYKKESFKQSELKAQERSEVYHKIGVKNGEQLKGKKVLLVDDVLTTGSTIKAAIHLIKPFHPKIIKIFVLARNCRKMPK